jgi:ADP-heptose:LPS heptosyltransferase
MSEGPVFVAIRLRQFGDVLATLGALAALRRGVPGARIVYVVDEAYHEVLRGVDFVDELLPSPPRVDGPGALAAYMEFVRVVRRMRPSAVLDFHGNARSALLTALSGARVRVGFEVRLRRRAYTAVEPRAVFDESGAVVPRTALDAALALAARAGAVAGARGELPEIRVAGADLARARTRLTAAGVPARAVEAGRVVGLNPGNPYPAKAWPRERFVALARGFADAGRHCVVLWGPREEDAARAIVDDAGDGVSLAPATRLGDLPALVRALALVVTIDSGLKHLAVCVRVPTVTLFGPTGPREWHMGTDRDRTLWRGLSCSPCRRRECPFGAPCMDFTPLDVLTAAAAIDGLDTR